MKGKLKDRLVRWLGFTGKIPQSSKVLYPFWLAAQLDEAQEQINFKQLPADLDNFTIAFASDPHYGPYLSKERVIDLSMRLNRMKADIIILAGDYGVDSKTAAAFFDILPPLKAKYGVYASIGNHDHRGSRESFDGLISAINKSGIKVIANTADLIHINQSCLCICATDDILEGEPDFDLLKNAVSKSDFVVFAPHSPDVIPLALKESDFSFDLALCGHTHGGQLVVLGRSLHSSSRYGDTYRSGLLNAGGKKLFVSNGIGTSVLPMRLGTRPQIHLITLKKSNS